MHLKARLTGIKFPMPYYSIEKINHITVSPIFLITDSNWTENTGPHLSTTSKLINSWMKSCRMQFAAYLLVEKHSNFAAAMIVASVLHEACRPV